MSQGPLLNQGCHALKTSLWQKVALVLFGVFLAASIFEMGARAAGFVILSLQEFRNLESVKRNGEYRILCLGESTTQNQYPQFLERILNRQNIGVRFSVIDKGVAGTNTSEIVGNAEAYLEEYRPQMVVAMMGINDEGLHIPFEAATASKAVLFVRSLRIYKIVRFLGLRLRTKVEELGSYGPGKKRAEIRSAGPDDAASPVQDRVKEAPKFDPKNDRDPIEMGLGYERQGQYAQAEDSFKKAIALDPENVEGYVQLGELYRQQQKFLLAEDFLQKAVARRPEDPQVHLVLGQFYQNQKKFSQTETAYKRAVELSPKIIATHVTLAYFYQDQGRLSEAEMLYKKANALSPDNDRIIRALSLLYEQMGEPELAREYAQKAKKWRFKPLTERNYRRLKDILDNRKIKLVCVGYPTCSADPLRKIFEKDENVILVDNEKVFMSVLKGGSYYGEYFTDRFGGSFGHCTQKGNRLLAQNIADVILKEVFRK